MPQILSLNMQFDWLLFDLDDTLLEFKKPADEALESTFSQYSIELDESKVQTYHSINKSVWSAFEKNEISVKELPVKRMELFLEAIERFDVDPDVFNDFYLDDLARRSRYYPETEEVLEHLKGRVRMAIITNGLSRVQRYRWKHTSLSNYLGYDS